jgi:hypothetical protein
MVAYDSIDAHDLSDAGMEAAAMERYVEQRLLLGS